VRSTETPTVWRERAATASLGAESEVAAPTVLTSDLDRGAGWLEAEFDRRLAAV